MFENYPWARIGRELGPNTSVNEALTVAGLNDPIVKRGIAMTDDEGNIMTEPLVRFNAICNGRTHVVHQVAGVDYKVYQNYDMVKVMWDFCEAGFATPRTIGSFEDGGIIFILADLKQGSTEVFGGSKIASKVLLVNSHNGKVSFKCKPTTVDIVCWNTFMMALRQKYANMFSLKHSSAWTPERAKQARAVLDLSAELNSETGEKIVRLSQAKLDEAGRVEFVQRLVAGAGLLQQVMEATPEVVTQEMSLLDTLVEKAEAKKEKDPLGRIGKQILQAIIDTPGSESIAKQGTFWGAMSGVTYWADHVRKSQNEENRLKMSWLGKEDKTKNIAFELALEMASAGGARGGMVQ